MYINDILFFSLLNHIFILEAGAARKKFQISKLTKTHSFVHDSSKRVNNKKFHMPSVSVRKKHGLNALLLLSVINRWRHPYYKTKWGDEHINGISFFGIICHQWFPKLACWGGRSILDTILKTFEKYIWLVEGWEGGILKRTPRYIFWHDLRDFRKIYLFKTYRSQSQ